MKTDDIVNIITIIGLALPVIISLVKGVAQYTHNKVLINLSNRADIIVKALEQSSDLSSSDKKERAIKALSEYANELGIKTTDKQLGTYIEASVNTIKNTTDHASDYSTTESNNLRSK